jgi:ABC-2 type transport system ATP-binding protein
MPRHERSEDPFAFATALAARLGAAPAELEIVRPSLEDVYLELVGETTADAVPGAAVQKKGAVR